MSVEPTKQLIELNSPQADICESMAQRVLFHSGVGIGKSQCAGLISMDFIRNNPEMRGFIGANTYRQLSISTLDRVFKVWEGIFKLKRDVDYVVDRIPPEGFKTFGAKLQKYNGVISFKNGAMIFTGSLDNYYALDGSEFGWAILDETKDTKEQAVKEVIVARLRQPGMYINKKTEKLIAAEKYLLKTREEKAVYDGFNPLYILTSPAKERWLSEWFDLDDYYEELEKGIYDKESYFRKRKGNKFVVIASSFHNEHNLSPGYLDRLAADLGHNKNLIKMLIYGSPFGKTGGEFYSAYSRTKHVKSVPYNKQLPVHISFDFNLSPYITMTLWQIDYDKPAKRYKVSCFAEMCLPAPKNNTEALCREAIRVHGDKFKNGLFYYGDYSGKNGNMMTSEYKHHYDVVDKLFKQYLHNLSDKVIVNPMVVKRRDFGNKLLSGSLPIDVEIDYSCKELIGDLEFIKEDMNGNKLKSRIKDELTGKTFEEHGHTSDSADYFWCSAFDFYFNA